MAVNDADRYAFDNSIHRRKPKNQVWQGRIKNLVNNRK